MREADTVPADTADHPVWQRIVTHQIGPSDAALSFSARLARENGWSAATAERVIEEYRRFTFLAVTGDAPATPSDAVDQAWHLHLSYTRDYWERFCPEVLGRALHHGPTEGGSEEHRRYYRQYADTLARYESAFGAPPPADIWPSAARRLIDDPRARRVHPRDGVIVPRPLVLAFLFAFAALAALALFQGVT